MDGDYKELLAACISMTLKFLVFRKDKECGLQWMRLPHLPLAGSQ
jgi:hypothetical protein